MSTTDRFRASENNRLSLKNRRRFPRLTLAEDVFLFTDREQFSLPLVNLSFSGAFVKTTHPLPLNSKVMLSWTNNSTGQKIEARVIRHEADGFAITFADITPALITGLCRIIWQKLIADGLLQGQLSGSEIPAGIMLLLDQQYQYKPLLTVSLGHQNAWIITEKIQFSQEELWITLPEHGLFDSLVEVTYSDADTVTNINFMQSSEEFRSAYSRLIKSYRNG